MESFNLCIIKPNKDAFSETFIQEHINRLPGNKKVLYGGAFPVYDHEGKFLIRSKLGLISYLIQKRLFKKKEIKVRTNALVNYLKREKIDVVFVEYGMVGAMVTDACKIANVPLVIHFHGADVYHKETVEAYKDLYKKAFDYASAFISVSADMVEDLKLLGAPGNKVYLASCGVDTDQFPQLDILNTDKNFLSIGRFVEKKSPASIVRAFKLVTETVSDARLWMVGQGPLFDETKALITELGLDEKITLTGVLKTDEIKKLMHQSRCFVQHSVTAANGDKEGTPVTILEAGSSGLAIVSTQHSGIKEAVINGETGYLVPEHDIQGMANYMIKIANDVQLASSLGIKEAAHIRKNYDIRDRINTLTTILQQAVHKN
jgi:colanic acid/amylovoran biosynthesis glycosyltransferase